MKMHFGSIRTSVLNRIPLRFVGVFVCLAIFGVLAWQTDARRIAFQDGSSPNLASSINISKAMQARILADRENDGIPADISSVPRAFPETGTVIYAYDTLNNRLVSFDASTPGTFITDAPLVGLDPGSDTLNREYLTAIDFRPANGLLYGVVTRGFPGRDNVATIDINSGVVARVIQATPLPPLPSIFSTVWISIL